MDFLSEINKIITANVAAAIKTAQEKGELPEAEPYKFSVEVPKDTSFGDFSTNAAMIGAKTFRKNPAQIASTIVANMELHPWLASAEVVGAFINFRMSPAYFADVVKNIEKEGVDYGRSDFGKGKKVMVEYVSANPTGMMHMGNARGGAHGDSLATVLKLTGHDVTREFYVNDAGNQIEKFKDSLEARYLQHFLGEEAVPFPEDGYKGADIIDRAEEFIELNADKYVEASSEERKAALLAYALPKNMEIIRANLNEYRAEYDVWFNESDLHNSGAVNEIIDILTKNGHTYKEDGAVWYRATDFGAEKDEVLIRKNGTPTYFAADIAYHRNKIVTRGFDKVINIWGADHYGHIARLKGALDAIDVDSSKLDVIVVQLVRLLQNGEAVKMSKRTGRSITLADLFDMTGVDAARFFFNLRKSDTHFDFDIDLSVAKTNQNPVYYVQYAHARICSILSVLRSEGIDPDKCVESVNYTEPAEKALINSLASYADELVKTAADYDVSRINKYTIDVASAFHGFYNDCRVKVEDENVMYSRIALVKATKTVLENALAVLKVTAPEKM
ncbi:MAG: arginine--tRNA ligase [Ruminococcaceae bacterium]|nr:arginine--tRNA ligase [Oscillospiraceae bacterium]